MAKTIKICYISPVFRKMLSQMKIGDNSQLISYHMNYLKDMRKMESGSLMYTDGNVNWHSLRCKDCRPSNQY